MKAKSPGLLRELAIRKTDTGTAPRWINGYNIFFVAIAALLLAAICTAAESARPAAQPSPSLPAKSGLPDVGKSQGKRYNVLFIAIDDLNDWVGCLGGNPQAMVMNKAYCASTGCRPMRNTKDAASRRCSKIRRWSGTIRR